MRLSAVNPLATLSHPLAHRDKGGLSTINPLGTYITQLTVLIGLNLVSIAFRLSVHLGLEFMKVAEPAYNAGSQ